MVARILASPEFQRAARLRAFLNYVVERKLAGSPEEVTETLIGHRVFGRPATYNPGEDSIVRTEARTLRQKLDRYFAAEGADEPVILEIPRGSYLPVFRPRAVTAPPAGSGPAATPAGPTHPALSRRQWIAGLGASAAGLLGMGVWVWSKGRAAARADTGSPTARSAAVLLESSDQRLTLAFQRARERVLSSVFTGDPVGDWYASNRDNRAFCMRDTAHENVGAALLGLDRQSLNMLRRFAASIAKSRDWCGYWIITKDGFPSPLEYAGDDNFSYSLPANFDLVRACLRQLLWTGDRQYLDPVFTGFYDRSVSQYVQAWDHDGDGIMEGRDDRPRVSATYHRQAPHFLTGADLVAAQYGGYLAYAAIQEIKGGRGSLSQRIAEEYRGKAGELHKRFNTEWWDPAQNRFRSGMLPDRSWSDDYAAPCNVYPLKFGIPEDGPKAEAALDFMERNRPPFDSTYSYYPEVLYHYGRNDSAYGRLLEISDPGFSGYPMTETAFAAIGSIGAGLMGISPDAPRSTVETMPRLPKALEWVRMENVPVAANRIAVEHRGNSETRFTNQAGTWLTWKVAFPIPPSGTSAGILIDGTTAPKLTFEHRTNRQPVICAAAPVKEGQTRVARLVV
ncbi:MAG: hypothetical protein ACLQU1_16695 [Bryobacteraceae bacterium]